MERDGMEGERKDGGRAIEIGWRGGDGDIGSWREVERRSRCRIEVER